MLILPKQQKEPSNLLDCFQITLPFSIVEYWMPLLLVLPLNSLRCSPSILYSVIQESPNAGWSPAIIAFLISSACPSSDADCPAWSFICFINLLSSVWVVVGNKLPLLTAEIDWTSNPWLSVE